VILTSNASADFKGAFLNASYDGYLRAGYQKQTNSEISVGGKLHFETAPINSVSFGSSFYTTQGIGKKYNDGVSFFDSNRDSYSILGEAYLKANIKNTLVKIGRQEFSSPYADIDDIGMIPNTFEALTIVNQDLKGVDIVFSHLQRFSGVDANLPEKFNKLNNDNGMQVIGVRYEGKEDLSVRGWYYQALKMVKLSYLEADYEKDFGLFGVGIGGQYTNQDYENGNEVDVFGVNLRAILPMSGLNFFASYNSVNSKNGQVAENFFGGGPFFTNCEHITLAEIGADARAYRYGVDYDMDGLTFMLSYLIAKGDNEESLNEIDIMASYALDADLSFDIIYSDTRDKVDGSNSFKNTRVFVNYNF
jgi:hypothetical protein